MGTLRYNRGFSRPSMIAMEAERLNQIESRIDDLRARVGELRRYL